MKHVVTRVVPCGMVPVLSMVRLSQLPSWFRGKCRETIVFATKHGGVQHFFPSNISGKNGFGNNGGFDHETHRYIL